MSDERDLTITRRSVLGAAAAGAGALAIAGCGGSSKASGTTTVGGTTGSTPKRGGILRLAPADGSASDSVDSLQNFTGAQIIAQNALYDPILRRDDQTAAADLYLAESLEPAPDLSYWTVRLRPANFHDGKPVTADDLIYTLQRAMNPKAGFSASALLAAVDPGRLQKLDSRTVRLHLKYPDISVPSALVYIFLVPVGYDVKKPIGTGPFKLKSFSPGVQSEFVRNDNYWQSGKPYLDELHMIDFADPGTTRINALISGQVDAAVAIAFTFAPTLDTASNITAFVSKGYGYVAWSMRMDMPPFDDTRVRQAIKLIAGRPQIVEQAYAGTRFASVGNDIPGVQDPLYDHSIPQRQQDIEQAKSLLKQAGREGLTVQLNVSDVYPGIVTTAQVLKQQAQAAGVTININNVPYATYFAKYYVQAPFKFDYYATTDMWTHIGFGMLPGAPSNITNFTNPQFVKLVTESRGTLDAAKSKALMFEAEQIMWNQGTQGIFAFEGTLDAYSPKFTGFKPSIMAYGLNGLHYEDVGLA